MRKVILFALVGIALSIATYGVYVSQQKEETMSDILLANIEAISDPEHGTAWDKTSCQVQGGNWNQASVCVASGFETFECTISGELNIFGVKVSGSYKKGNKYPMPWARYECKDSVENCCTKQGMYSGNDKLA